MADKLLIQRGNSIFEPAVLDGVTWTLERFGSPGKLEFTVMKNGTNSFLEGDVVRFYHDDIPVFFGFVFTKNRSKDGLIKVTAYDQLRYFKNKYTYVFTNRTATQIISLLANDFRVKTGKLQASNYIIPSLIEENKTAFDIVGDALDETLLNTGNMFVLYDDFGSLTLKNAADMMSTLIIDKDTAEDFDYKSSIDDETYNKIVLYYKGEDNTLIPYYAKDDSNINQWGLLQYFEEVKNQTIAQNKANALLKLYNQKTRTLSIKGAFGDARIRAGSLVIVHLDLGDKIVKNYMLVESVTHSFKENHHTMELTLEGAWSD